jgi:hypothetical protein
LAPQLEAVELQSMATWLHAVAASLALYLLVAAVSFCMTFGSRFELL